MLGLSRTDMGRSRAKIWMQGLQKCWAKRDIKQPPSPEPSLGLFVFTLLSKATPAQLCQEGSRTGLQFPATSTARPTIREGLLCY